MSPQKCEYKIGLLPGVQGKTLNNPQCSREQRVAPGANCIPQIPSSRETFESSPKCDLSEQQKGWRRRHPFLAERLLMRTLLGKTNLRCRGKLRLCVFLLSLAVLSCLALGLQVSRYTHAHSKQALTSLRVASLFGELRPAFCVSFAF